MSQDPNRPSSRDFDIRIRMIASDGELAYVTVEGPDFSVVPRENFLRALMVRGLDPKNPEGRTQVYGRPARPTQGSLDQVVAALGAPSETKGGEVIFNYTLKGTADRSSLCSVQYKVTKDGLLLEGDTNLAGGRSVFWY